MTLLAPHVVVLCSPNFRCGLTPISDPGCPQLKNYYSPIWIAMRWYKARAFMRHHKTSEPRQRRLPIKHKGLIPFSSKLVIQQGCHTAKRRTFGFLRVDVCKNERFSSLDFPGRARALRGPRWWHRRCSGSSWALSTMTVAMKRTRIAPPAGLVLSAAADPLASQRLSGPPTPPPQHACRGRRGVRTRTTSHCPG